MVESFLSRQGWVAKKEGFWWALLGSPVSWGNGSQGWF